MTWTHVLNEARLRLLPRRMPPGEDADLDQAERYNRQVLLDLAVEYGPIFSGRMEGQHTTFIVDLALAKRFLKIHTDRLQPYTLDISSLVPNGFIRQMQGDVHRHYRSEFAQALARSDMEALLAEIPGLELDLLQRFTQSGDFRAETYLQTLTDTATRFLCRVFFGSASRSLADELHAGYQALGPHGLMWRPGVAQHDAFRLIESLLRDGLANGLIDNRSVLGAAAGVGEVDATLLGNFIYSVEMGRYDLRGMYRLLTMHAAAHPERLREIGVEAQDGQSRLAKAFAEEELRTDQSERLVRRVLRDIQFDGWFIPAGSLVRICMWEVHHDPAIFALPMRFDPDRFLNADILPAVFSPYGLDRHQCPFALLMSVAGIRFLRALSQFDLLATGDRVPIRGAYHWEPAFDFSINLERKITS